jgi:hypothetical protein
MVAHHRGLAITPEERFRFASLLSLAADDAGLPDDPEFRSALVAYVEWGTRLAMHNSQPGAEVVEQAPVPRWGWGEAPPVRAVMRPSHSEPPSAFETVEMDEQHKPAVACRWLSQSRNAGPPKERGRGADRARVS